MDTGEVLGRARSCTCWNWKCALMSATVRTSLYGLALARGHAEGRAAVLLVEMLYVSLTAGLYAGWQQKALELRSHLVGNMMVVIGVPGLSQLLDWAAHRAVGAAAPQRAILASAVFTLLSALFHLHVMRRGAFLTGKGRSLTSDFRQMPRLVLEFLQKPVILAQNLAPFLAQPKRSANRAHSLSPSGEML
jgi:hypothetical protein